VAKAKTYAVYKGDTLLCMGTKKECARLLNVQPETIKYYTTPAYKKRVEKRKNSRNSRTVISWEDEE
jgi:hypothetical protein